MLRFLALGVAIVGAMGYAYTMNNNENLNLRPVLSYVRCSHNDARLSNVVNGVSIYACNVCDVTLVQA